MKIVLRPMAAARKLSKDISNVGKLTFQELESFLRRVYSITVPGAKSKLRKTDFVQKMLRKDINSKTTIKLKQMLFVRHPHVFHWSLNPFYH